MAGRVCPVWIGYILASPIRRLFENPEKILDGYLKPGMVALDAGCAMGFFSLAMARMVGSQGKIISVDLQDKMIKSLNKRAARASLSDRIDARVCIANNLRIDDLADKVDFALAFHVIHEVPDAPGFLNQIYNALKPGAKLFIAEPRGHVTPDEYKATVGLAQQIGFNIISYPEIKRDWSTVLLKP